MPGKQNNTMLNQGGPPVKVLVTGACGRVGAHVVRQLLDRGIDIIGVDALVHSGNLRSAAGRVRIVPADVDDLATLLHIVKAERITRIVHLAAVLGDRYDSHPWGSYTVNLGGTLNVLEAARLGGVERVVAASTHDIYPKAYGDYGPPKRLPMSEDHVPDPRRPYPVMKLASEYMGRYYAEHLGVDYAAIRFATYYSAERALQRGVKPHDLVSRLILSAVERVPLSLAQGGDYVFDPIYIKDCAHGVVCSLLRDGRCEGLVFNIGGGRAVSLFHAADTVRRLFPHADISIGGGDLSSPDGQGHHAWLSIDRARQLLGYEPQYSLDTGIMDCARELETILDARGGRPT